MQYAANIRRIQFQKQIDYKPTQAIFRGEEITIRIDEPSYNRKMQNYGFERDITLEAMVIAEEKPRIKSDTFIIDNARYDIESVNADPAAECWHVELKYKGAIN